MTTEPRSELTFIGRVIAGPTDRDSAPSQGREAKTAGRIELDPRFRDGLKDLAPGRWLWLLLWFDRADRSRLQVHPRGDKSRSLTGVFNARSPHRPNPIALDLVRLEALDDLVLTVSGLDAVIGTPVLDIKPVMPRLDRPEPDLASGERSE